MAKKPSSMSKKNWIMVNKTSISGFAIWERWILLVSFMIWGMLLSLDIKFINPKIEAFYTLFLFSAPLFALLFPLIRSFFFNKYFGSILWGMIFIYLFVFMFKLSDAADLFKNGDQSLVEIQRINLGPKDFVVYRTNCGATCDYGVAFRQERILFPGAIFDQVKLGGFNHAYEVYFKKTGDCTVELDRVSGYGDEKLIPKDLQYRLCGGARTDFYNHIIGSEKNTALYFHCENGEKLSIKVISGPELELKGANTYHLILEDTRKPIRFASEEVALTFPDIASDSMTKFDKIGFSNTVCHKASSNNVP